MAGFGLLLRHWREARGLSQQALAGESGFMPSAATLFPNLSFVHNWPQTDETGTINLVLYNHVFERYELVARHASIMLARGQVGVVEADRRVDGLPDQAA